MLFSLPLSFPLSLKSVKHINNKKEKEKGTPSFRQSSLVARSRVWQMEHELDFRPHLPINSTHLYSSHSVQLFTATLIIGAYLMGGLHVYDYYLAYSTVDL